MTPSHTSTSDQIQIQIATPVPTADRSGHDDEGFLWQCQGLHCQSPFHIALYMGELMAKEPEAFFHVISGDTGFAPLLAHMTERKVLARQYKEIGQGPRDG